MSKDRLIGSGIVVSSLMAISCCIGPAIFLLTGASVAVLGQLSFLDPYRPFFLTTGFLLLGIAVWRIFVKKKNCTCAADKRKRIVAQILTLMGLFLLLLASFFTNIVEFFIGRF